MLKHHDWPLEVATKKEEESLERSWKSAHEAETWANKFSSSNIDALFETFKIDRSVTLFAITFSTCNWSSKFSNAESIGTKQIGTRTESSSIIVIGINYGENLY